MSAASDSHDHFQPVAGRYRQHVTVCAVSVQRYPIGYNRYKPTPSKQPSSQAILRAWQGETTIYV